MVKNTVVSRISALIRGSALVLGIALVVSGCAGNAENMDTLPAPANPTEQGATTPDNSTTPPEQNNPSELPATGALNLDDQTIIFSPTLCIIDDEDVLIDAPGINQSSMQAAFLSIDLSMIDGQRHGEARIELGVNDAFSSSDDFYTTFINPNETYSLTIEGNEITIDAVFRFADGVSRAEGSLTVRCS